MISSFRKSDKRSMPDCTAPQSVLPNPPRYFQINGGGRWLNFSPWALGHRGCTQLAGEGMHRHMRGESPPPPAWCFKSGVGKAFLHPHGVSRMGAGGALLHPHGVSRVGWAKPPSTRMVFQRWGGQSPPPPAWCFKSGVGKAFLHPHGVSRMGAGGALSPPFHGPDWALGVLASWGINTYQKRSRSPSWAWVGRGELPEDSPIVSKFRNASRSSASNDSFN